ncbi:hypothetical protein BCR44DRAFT_1436793 [Catenaria anguillulae PL171]|uniref:Cation efflux protein transmembrane domain-containing protein n=1 Tax=Catenaria anguillulae PL171 TaxID=765915 RepID=A0A1Y2HK35_9FUNG|nr:hypothetical protein BCR44DRAFT_1436793 [Catenaria anguillulae PL171]
MRASRQPDSLHPYGFSRERYAWSLLSGCGIFFLGGGVSMYHGITGILNPHLAEDLHLAFMVLAGSAQVRKAAEESEMGVLDYIKKGADPTAVQILLEDAAAISGVAVASTCLGLSYYTGNPLFDALGSTLIGGILGTTAIFLIRRNMAMLVETSMPPHREALVVSTLLADPIVKSVHDVKSTAIGLDGARFKAERLASMEGVDWEKERDKVLGMQDKDELARKTVPEVKHIDLEIL